MSNQSPVIHSETLMCGGKKCCPTVTVYEDGSVDLADTDNGKDEWIHLDANQAKMLRDRLNKSL